MGVPVKEIAAGKCYVTGTGQVRRVLAVTNGKIKYESRLKAAHVGSWETWTIEGNAKFAWDVDREVPCDYDPENADKAIPVDQLNASNDE